MQATPGKPDAAPCRSASCQGQAGMFWGGWNIVMRGAFYCTFQWPYRTGAYMQRWKTGVCTNAPRQTYQFGNRVAKRRAAVSKKVLAFIEVSAIIMRKAAQGDYRVFGQVNYFKITRRCPHTLGRNQKSVTSIF